MKKEREATSAYFCCARGLLLKFKWLMGLFWNIMFGDTIGKFCCICCCCCCPRLRERLALPNWPGGLVVKLLLVFGMNWFAFRPMNLDANCCCWFMKWLFRWFSLFCRNCVLWLSVWRLKFILYVCVLLLFLWQLSLDRWDSELTPVYGWLIFLLILCYIPWLVWF